MRFLVDANMPRSTMALLGGLGHTAEHARDIGLGGAPDAQIAARARSTGAALITRDLDFADIRNYPPHEFKGLLVLRMPDDAAAQTIVNLLERFLKQTQLASQLPGHLSFLKPIARASTPRSNDRPQRSWPTVSTLHHAS